MNRYLVSFEDKDDYIINERIKSIYINMFEDNIFADDEQSPYHYLSLYEE